MPKKVLKSNHLVAKSWRQLLLLNRVIAVIRASRVETALAMAKAVAAGGIGAIEVTWNSEQPAAIVSQIEKQLPECTVGAGTILDLEQLRQAIAAGAQFVFCPHFNRALLEAAERHQVPLVPGVLTPTEAVAAWQAGATTVKVFPIRAVGGATYLAALRKPLTQIDFIPTGGVTIDNAKAMLEAGAIAVAISSDLFPAAAVAAGDWQTITQRTQNLLAKIQEH